MAFKWCVVRLVTMQSRLYEAQTVKEHCVRLKGVSVKKLIGEGHRTV